MKHKKILTGTVSVLIALAVLAGSFAIMMARAQEVDVGGGGNLPSDSNNKKELNFTQGLKSDESILDENVKSAESDNKSIAGQAVLSKEEKMEDSAPRMAASSVVDVATETNFSKYQTYNDASPEAIYSVPPELIVTLEIVLSDSLLENARVEIPYTFIPDEDSYPNFNREYDGEPFFILNDVSELDGASIIDNYDTSDSSKLVINLKDKAEAGAYAVKICYRFNSEIYITPAPNFYGVIPDKTVLWTIQPTVYVGENVAMMGEVKQIESTSNATFTFDFERQLPTAESYSAGAISASVKMYNRNNHQLDFDNNYENILYIDLPTGSTINSIELLQAFTKERQVIINGKLYDRYYENVSNIEGDTKSWNVSGNITQQTNIIFTPPSDLELAEVFYVGMGVEIKRENSVVENKAEYRAYVKEEPKLWDFYSSSKWYTGAEDARVFVGEQDSKSTDVSLGGGVYASPYTTKNMGTSPIQGVKQEIYLAEVNQEEKIDFTKLQVITSVDISNKDLGGLPTPSQYRMDFLITNGSDTRKQSIALVPDTSSGQYNKGMFTFEIPDVILADNEYIERISLIPMGVNGISEGELPPSNGFSIQFQAKNWSNGKWPSGSEMTQAEIPFAGELTYINESGELEIKTSDVENVYYEESPSKLNMIEVSVRENQTFSLENLAYHSAQSLHDKKNMVNEWGPDRIVQATLR